MKLLRNRWGRWLFARLRSSIVVRTTLAILALSMILGLTFALIVSASVDRREQQRAQIRLEQLLSTVERTAQIACYLKDRNLAAEIAQGLMRNRAVSAVRITSGSSILSQIGDAVPAHSHATNSAVVAMRIYSPFDEHEPVGEISLFVDHAAIHVEASTQSGSHHGERPVTRISTSGAKLQVLQPVSPLTDRCRMARLTPLPHFSSWAVFQT